MEQTHRKELKAKDYIRSEYLESMPEDVQAVILRYYCEAQYALNLQALHPEIDKPIYIWERLHKDQDDATKRMIEWFNSNKELKDIKSIEHNIFRVLNRDAFKFCDGQVIKSTSDGSRNASVMIESLLKNSIDHDRKMEELREKEMTEQIKPEFLKNMTEDVERDVLYFISSLQDWVTHILDDPECVDSGYEVWTELNDNKEEYEKMTNWLQTNVVPEEKECTAHKLMRVIDLDTIDKCDSIRVEINEKENLLDCICDSGLWFGLGVTGPESGLTIGRYGDDFMRWPFLHTEYIKKEYLKNMPINVEDDLIYLVTELERLLKSSRDAEKMSVNEIWYQFRDEKEDYSKLKQWFKLNVAPEKEECTAKKLLRVINTDKIPKEPWQIIDINSEKDQLECIILDDTDYVLWAYPKEVKGEPVPDENGWPVLD